LFRGLEFNDYCVGYQQIQSVSALYFYTLVYNGKLLLSVEWDLAQ